MDISQRSMFLQMYDTLSLQRGMYDLVQHNPSCAFSHYCDSGANDGLGYPFLFLATYLIQQPTATALNEWTLHVMLYEICFSVVLGFVAGYVARKLLKFAQKK